MHILHLDSSVLGAASVSRQLSAGIVARYHAQYPFNRGNSPKQAKVARRQFHGLSNSPNFFQGGRWASRVLELRVVASSYSC